MEQQERMHEDFVLTRRILDFHIKYSNVEVRGTNRRGFDLLSFLFNTGVSHNDMARIFGMTMQRISQLWYSLYCPVRDRGLLPPDGFEKA